MTTPNNHIDEELGIVYLRPDNTVAENAIYRRTNKATGEVIFCELLDLSTCVKGGLRVNGKEPYKRIFVQRVYPSMLIKEAIS